MKQAWLAIDTATGLASVAVWHPREGEHPVDASDVLRGSRRQASGMVLLVDNVLQRAETTLDDLAGIVVGDGPGSFTGLRIGWAVAKGLAQVRDIPMHAVPSLMGLAWVGWHEVGRAKAVTIAACYDALRGQVYGAIYRLTADRVETIVPPAAMTIGELRQLAPSVPDAAIGDGARRFAEEIQTWIARAPLKDLAEHDGHATVARGLLALIRYEGAAYRISVPATAEPVYGRLAEAQVKWEARHGRPLRDPSRPGR